MFCGVATGGAKNIEILAFFFLGGGERLQVSSPRAALAWNSQNIFFNTE